MGSNGVLAGAAKALAHMMEFQGSPAEDGDAIDVLKDGSTPGIGDEGVVEGAAGQG